MYFYPVYSPEFLIAAFGRKSMRKVFWDATELMVVIYHEFVGKPISPPYTSLSCPFHMGITALIENRPIG